MCLVFILQSDFRAMIMSTSVSAATFTISDTKPDSSATFPFCILLIDSLTMSYIKRGTPLTVSTGTSNCYGMQTVFKSFSLTLLPTSSFHQVTLCLAGPFVHQEILSVASKKALFRMFQ